MKERKGVGSIAPVELVIFDCDGVLVDSEPLAIRVLVSAIADQGIAIDPADAYRNYLGRSLASISQSLFDSHGEPLGEAALDAMRHELYALYRTELRAMPGLAEAVGQITVPVCVASSSSPERIGISLAVTGIATLFGDNVYSATMVANGKPAPDLFLHAAAQMGANPQNCLVIEDSPAGIRAARSAGMAVFGFTGGSHVGPARLREAVTALSPDAVFDDMADLPRLMAALQAEVVS